MTEFDYVCLFLAIPIGLALVELAQGLSLALRRGGEIRLGWLTPFTVVFMLLVISMMIENFWSLRDTVVVSLPIIFVGFLFTIVFYVAASFVFPERMDGQISLDDWFMRQRRFSLGGTTVLGAGFFFYFLIDGSDSFDENPFIFGLVTLLILGAFLSPVVLAIRAPSKARALLWLIVVNAISLMLTISFVVRSL